MKVWHHWQLKKSKSWGPFLSYQLNNTANSAHIPRKWAKWAELAVLFSWQLKNGPQYYDFFNCQWCQTFILAEIHCPLSARIFHATQFQPGCVRMNPGQCVTKYYCFSFLFLLMLVHHFCSSPLVRLFFRQFLTYKIKYALGKMF